MAAGPGCCEAALMLGYDDTGTGTPLVLLHGLGSSRRRWDPVIEHLPDGIRCIAVDLPGHGDSPEEGCDATSSVVAVHDLVVALGLDRPVVVGHSLGAVVALLYAAMRPTRSAVAVDPVGLHLPTLAAALAPYRDELAHGDTLEAFWTFEETHILAGDPSAASFREGLDPRPEVIRSYWKGLLDPSDDVAERQPGFAAVLASIPTPTLVVLPGEPGDEDAGVLDGMQSAMVEVWAGQGHWLHLTDSARFARRLLEWVAALDR